ncbi:MAG: M13 family metallopeptidase [Kofleriaceae bacterium]
MVRSLVLFACCAAACGSSHSTIEPVVAPSSPSSPAPPPAVRGPTLAGVYSEDIDRSADPCDDFYEFSNGTWRKANPIPASMTRWSRRWKAGEDSKQRLKDILDQVSAKRDWKPGSVEQLIGDFYGACMDETAVDAAGAKPLAPIRAEIAAIKDKAGVVAMIAKLHHQSIPVPFAVGAQSDLHDPTDVIADIGASGLGLPDRDYYVKTEQRFVDARARYLVYAAELFQLVGDDASSAQAHARTVLAFETRLAKASLDNVALRDPKASDHKLTVAELQQLTPSLDWTAYLKAFGVPASAPVNVDQPAFMKEVEHELAHAPIATWRTYLEWQYISSMTDGLSKPFVDATYELFDKFLAGAQEQKPRWKRCVEQTDHLLGEALGQKYVEKYFPPAAKARMTELVHNLLAAMKDTIDHLEWMTPQTKQKALQKLATFNPKIGYPDKWKDYSAIPIKRDALFADLVAARTWNVDDDREQIGKPLDRGRWGMTPPTSDAYYNPALNEIVFPAGILQPPAFRLDAVDAINYGAIGVVIGHEISHGFDDQGAQFDAQGRLENWWTKADLDAFTARGKCVVDQFDGYFIEPKVHHNGKLVLGESIGDSGGANLAYRAFHKALEARPAANIDGFTPDQQFFIAWGQFRSDAIRIEQQRLMVQGDPHPIAKFRVIGPLSNMPEFARAFSCKPGSAMVRPPAQQCRVW